MRELVTNQELFETECRKRFDMTDTDQSGSVDREELKVLFEGLARSLECEMEITEEYLDRQMTALDLNSDQALSYAEFKNLY
jgi:Ca2+-binding EF-hand superfamily protein